MPHCLPRHAARTGAAVALALLLGACGDAAEPAAPAPTEPPDETPTPAETVATEDPTAAEPAPTPEETEGGEIDAADAVTVITVDIIDGQATVSRRVDVALGAPVRLEVTSDVADEVHVHGYDLEAELAAGQTAVIEFDADIPGVFEVELHSSHQQLFQLRVQ